MGAFGELLQQYFGGTKHDVKTWGKSKSITNLDLEEDRKFIEFLGKKSYNLSEIFREDFKTEKGWKEFELWKKSKLK
ncbi:MAG: hypothetical protein ABIP51_16905 [Bacteroidia bacterium]